VVKEVGGSKLVVETLKTASATIVRYQLPANVSSFSPPMLRAGASTLAPAQSRQEQGPQGSHEVWFEATPDNLPLVLVFDRLAASDPSSKPWTLKVALAPFQAPAPKAGVDDEEQQLTWELQADSSPEPPLKGILWRRLPDRVELEITIGGLWDQPVGGAPVPPVILGDGVQIKVDSVGTYPAFGERGDETKISFRLSSQAVPRGLVVIGGGGRTSMLPPLEVTLQD
jgi:hypothetical protein